MQEIFEKRKKRSKLYDMGDGSKRCVASIAPVHFQDSSGDWQDIDYTINGPNPGLYRYQTMTNKYTVYFKDDYSAPNFLRFERDNARIDITISALALYDPDTNEYISYKLPRSNTAPPEVGTRAITFEEIFDGCNSKFVNTGDGIKEYLTINNLTDLPDPVAEGYNPNTAMIALVAEISHNCDGVRDSQGDVTEGRDLDKVEFYIDDIAKVYIPQLIGFGTDTGDGWTDKVTVRMKQSGNRTFLIHAVPYLSIATSLPPYIIDATFAATVATGNDDTYNASSIQWYPTADYAFIGVNEHTKSNWLSYVTFWRFVGVTIPQGATLSGATFTYIYSIQHLIGQSTSYYMWACSCGDVGAWTTANDTWTLPYFSTSFNTNASATGNQGSTHSWNCQTALQPLFNSTAWTSGNALALRVQSVAVPAFGSSDGRAYIASYDNSTYGAAGIEITYTTGGAPTSSSQFIMRRFHYDQRLARG